MLVSKTEQYYEAPFESEAELEQVVREYAEQLFGSNALFLPKAKVTTLGGSGTIPDGFVIDIESGDWYIVEAELAAHGTWQHIAPQVSKQIAAIKASESRDAILKLALEEIKNDESVQEAISDLDIADIEIHGRLQAILRKDPVVAIPIDSIPRDLDSWAKSLRLEVRIWEIGKFTTLDGRETIYSLPGESMPSATSRTGFQGEAIVDTKGSLQYDSVLAAGLIHIGQKVLMSYGRKGARRQTFHGVLREQGVEVDGRIMSLSAAALYCMRKAGSKRASVNGWLKWRTEDGTLLNEYHRQCHRPEEPAE